MSIEIEDVVFFLPELVMGATDRVLGDEDNTAVAALVFLLATPFMLVALVLSVTVVWPILIVGAAIAGVVVLAWRVVKFLLGPLVAAASAVAK